MPSMAATTTGTLASSCAAPSCTTSLIEIECSAPQRLVDDARRIARGEGAVLRAWLLHAPGAALDAQRSGRWR